MFKPRLTLSQRTELALAVSCWSCGELLRTRHVSEAWIELEVESGWTAAYRIAAKDGKPLIAEVRVFPTEDQQRTPGQWSNDAGVVPTGGLSSGALRALHLGVPRSVFPRITRIIRRSAGREGADRILAPFGLRPTGRLERHRPGRAGRPDEFYLIWAVAYVQRISEGSRQPVKDLAQDPPESMARFTSNRKRPSVETVRGFINEARDRGLLTRPPPGKPGGRLTAKAWKMLQAVGLDPHS